MNISVEACGKKRLGERRAAHAAAETAKAFAVIGAAKGQQVRPMGAMRVRRQRHGGRGQPEAMATMPEYHLVPAVGAA